MTLKDIIWFESCDSTMDVCHRFSDITKNEISIGALSQLKGRGTKNRLWVSPKGNVFLSFLLHPYPFKVHIIHMLGTLAIYEFLSQSFHFEKISLKWPNDVMVQGKKISGVLQENIYQNQDLTYSVLGIGLNVNLEEIHDINTEYTSMKIITGKSYNVKNIASKVIPYFDNLYYSSKTTNEIVSLWKNKIDTIGKDVFLEMKDNKRLSGKVKGVNDEGDLLLVKTDKTQLTIKSGLVTKLIIN
jgi:BirA family biotin operon repressor/biotin-[acetyl-CoA-carboxylase] ligase